MHLVETCEQRELRARLRGYLADLLTPAVRAELADPATAVTAFRTCIRRLGTDGWLGLAWPVEYGGRGGSAVDQFILFDEIQRAQAPFPFVTVNTVGPAIMAHGTDAQKQHFLPKILAGAVNVAIGSSELAAGTDLAALTTSAYWDGDEWVVNGAKVYTSGANQADYVWLACRTDAEASRHRGISILAVPTDAAGFAWTPIHTLGGVSTTATYYDAVRVPADALIGPLHGGWDLITMQLNHERVGLAALSGLTERLVEDVTEWARTTPAHPDAATVVFDEPWVQLDLARCRALVDATRLMTWRLVDAVGANRLGPAEASCVKVFGTERAIDVYRLLQGVLGASAHLRVGAPGALLAGEVERAARAAQINTFGGGVNEVQRDLVAVHGLGLTRHRL
jgi:3-oxocholest-4-en-26-oyl-CoA dehydrogenase alpha subunit